SLACRPDAGGARLRQHGHGRVAAAGVYNQSTHRSPAMKSPSKALLATLAAALALAAPAFAALKPGAPAPDFSAPAYLAGEPFTFKLAEALERGPVVVYFFPAAHTPGCSLEAALFSQAIDKFKARHATVIGVTAGNTDELAEFSKETEHCGG